MRLARDESPDVRKAAIVSMNLMSGDTDNDEVTRVLHESVDDADRDVSVHARIGLAARGMDWAPPLWLLFKRGFLKPRALRAAAARRDPGYRAILEVLRARGGNGMPRRVRALLDAAIEACTLPM